MKNIKEVRVVLRDPIIKTINEFLSEFIEVNYSQYFIKDIKQEKNRLKIKFLLSSEQMLNRLIEKLKQDKFVEKPENMSFEVENLEVDHLEDYSLKSFESLDEIEPQREFTTEFLKKTSLEKLGLNGEEKYILDFLSWHVDFQNQFVNKFGKQLPYAKFIGVSLDLPPDMNPEQILDGWVTEIKETKKAIELLKETGCFSHEFLNFVKKNKVSVFVNEEKQTFLIYLKVENVGWDEIGKENKFKIEDVLEKKRRWRLIFLRRMGRVLDYKFIKKEIVPWTDKIALIEYNTPFTFYTNKPPKLREVIKQFNGFKIKKKEHLIYYWLFAKR